MNHSQRVNSTAHWFGEHRPDTHNLAFRHRNVDETPLVIALGLTVLFVSALIWCCVSPMRSKRSGYSDHDPEAAVANGPPFTNSSRLHDQGFHQYSKFLRSTYNRTRAVTLPHTVYDPFRHRVSLTRSQRSSDYMDAERSRSLSSLPSLPLYRPDAESFSTLVQLHDLHPPPEYSSPPGSPSTPTPTHASSSPPNGDMEVQVSGTDHQTTSGPDLSSAACLPWKLWKDFPLSLSQPTITAISSTLNRTLSSPGRYTSNHNNVSSSTLYTPTNDLFYGSYTVFLDQTGRIVLPHLSNREQITSSDSIVTISPCDMISTTGDLSDAKFLDQTCNDSCDGTAPLASEYFASDGIPDVDQGGQEPKLAPIHQANQIGLNTETSA